jgi:hypothetical protein
MYVGVCFSLSLSLSLCMQGLAALDNNVRLYLALKVFSADDERPIAFYPAR